MKAVRTERINLRCSVSEKRALQDLSEELNLTLTDMLLGLGSILLDLHNNVDDASVLQNDVWSYLYFKLGAKV